MSKGATTTTATTGADNKHLLVATSRKLSKEYRQLYGLLAGAPAAPYTTYRSEDSGSDGPLDEEGAGDGGGASSLSASGNGGGWGISTLASTVYNHSANVVSKTVGWTTSNASHPPTNPDYLAPASLQAAVHLPISTAPCVEHFLIPMLLSVPNHRLPTPVSKQKNSSQKQQDATSPPSRRRLQALRAQIMGLRFAARGDSTQDAKRKQLRIELNKMAMEFATLTGMGQLAEALSRIDTFTSSFTTEVVPLLKSNGAPPTSSNKSNIRVFPIREVTYEAAFSASEAVDAVVAEIDRRGSLLNQLLLVCDHFLANSTTADNGAAPCNNNSGVLSYLGFSSSTSGSTTTTSPPVGTSTSTSQYLFDTCVKGYTTELRGRCRNALSMSAVESGGSALMSHLCMVKQAASAVVENGFDGLGVPTAPSYDNIFDADSQSPCSFTSFNGDLPSNAQMVHGENGFDDNSPTMPPPTPTAAASSSSSSPAAVRRNSSTRKNSDSTMTARKPTTTTTFTATDKKIDDPQMKKTSPSKPPARKPSLKDMKRVASSSALPEGRRTAIEEQRVVLQDGTDATLFVEVPLDELDLHAEQQRHREIEEITRGMAEVNELQALINQHAVRQEEHMTAIEKSAGVAQMRAASGRIHLTQASKYQVVGAVVAGAVLGAAVGGPIGLLIGAKSVATVGGALALGGVTGGVGAKVVTSASAKNASNVDDDYEDRRERGEL